MRVATHARRVTYVGVEEQAWYSRAHMYQEVASVHALSYRLCPRLKKRNHVRRQAHCFLLSIQTFLVSLPETRGQSQESLPGRPRGSPVQYQLARFPRHRVLYGRPSRSPWSPWKSNHIPGKLSQTLGFHRTASHLVRKRWQIVLQNKEDTHKRCPPNLFQDGHCLTRRLTTTYALLSASRSISILTSSLTSTPPLSSAAFQLRPHSLRFSFVLALRPATCIPQGFFPWPWYSALKVTGFVTPRIVRSPSTLY